MAPPVRNLTDVLEDPAEDLPTVQQIAELFLRTSTTIFTNKTLADISNYIHADATHLKVTALEDINVGQPIKFTSYNLGLDQIQVNLADKDLGVSIGLASETILSGNDFTIITNGFLKGLDTTAYTDGQILYLNGVGQLTHTEPTTGLAQPIAFCVKSAGGLNGSLMVNASYPKQDAADVRFNSNGDSVHDVLSVMSNKNKLINGGFNINQRVQVSGNVAIDTNTYYTLDRWKLANGTDTISFSTTEGKTTVTAPSNGIIQVIEGATLQSGIFIISWDGTATCTVDATTRINGESFNVTGGSNITVKFSSGTVANVQLEIGSVATLFEQRLIGLELSLCHRYYAKGSVRGTMAQYNSGSAFGPAVQFPSKLRTIPTTVITLNEVRPDGTSDDTGVTLAGNTITDVNMGIRISNITVGAANNNIGYCTLDWTANAEL